MTDHPSRATDKLLSKMWRTKSARFNAHARLKSRHWCSIAATALLALYVVAASIVQIAFHDKLQGEADKLISVGTLIVSIFLIIVTLLETARNYLGEAESMHESALGIAEIYNQFQALTVERANAERVAFNDKYSAALKAIPVDHKNIDFVLFKLRSADDLGIHGVCRALLYPQYLWLWLWEYSLYLGLILLPPIALILYLK